MNEEFPSYFPMKYDLPIIMVAIFQHTDHLRASLSDNVDCMRNH